MVSILGICSRGGKYQVKILMSSSKCNGGTRSKSFLPLGGWNQPKQRERQAPPAPTKLALYCTSYHL